MAQAKSKNSIDNQNHKGITWLFSHWYICMCVGCIILPGREGKKVEITKQCVKDFKQYVSLTWWPLGSAASG